jgi:hypothetical protein
MQRKKRRDWRLYVHLTVYIGKDSRRRRRRIGRRRRGSLPFKYLKLNYSSKSELLGFRTPSSSILKTKEHMAKTVVHVVQKMCRGLLLKVFFTVMK